jgi:hypothetical protein
LNYLSIGNRQKFLKEELFVDGMWLDVLLAIDIQSESVEIVFLITLFCMKIFIQSFYHIFDSRFD